MKFITMLQEQNNELHQELERFLVSDNEIRGKLMDRERSPLKMRDLYSGGVQQSFDKRAPEEPIQ